MSAFAVKRPVFTFVTMLLILILGTVSVTRIPLKLIPDLNPPVAVVVSNYEGASPTEVLEKVTKPLESQLSTLPGLQSIQSTSQEGSNLLFLEFSWSTNIETIENEVISRINQTPIPDEASTPRFLKFDPSQFPIIQLAIRGETEGSNVQELAKQLQTELAKIQGVASVDSSGAVTENITITLDEGALTDNNLTSTQVVNTIRANNISSPGEPIVRDEQQLSTRIVSEIQSIDEIRELVITANPNTGNEVTVDDVATLAIADPDQSTITRANEFDAVLFSILQEADANTASVSSNFEDELNNLLTQEQFADIEADILFDQGDYIEIAIKNIATSLVLGGLFAMLVLFFFLRNVKSPLIIGVAIPYSVVLTFVLMYFADFSLNIMTLGGLALGIGMLVDNAIVVIENINRHLSLKKKPKEAAVDGTKEISSAITASTLTTVVVFLPVVFISGIIGEIFLEFALTISFSLVASLVVSVTVVPMLASRLLRAPKSDKGTIRVASKPARTMERIAEWSLKRRWTVIMLTVLVLLGSVFGFVRVGTEFLPATDEGFFTIRVSLDDGTSLQETERTVAAIEEILEDREPVDVFVSLIGSTQEGSFQGTGSSNQAELYVKMKGLADRDISTLAFMDGIREEMEKAATNVNDSAELNLATQSAAGSSPDELSFSVRDSDKARLDEAILQLEEALSGLEEVRDLTIDREEVIPELQIEINREEARVQGLTPAQIASYVGEATRGVTATQIVNENNEVQQVFVQLEEEAYGTIDELNNLQLRNGAGQLIELQAVASVTEGEGPVALNRIDEQDAVQFTLTYASTVSLGEVSQLVDEKIQELGLPDSTQIAFGGDRELLEDAINDLLLAFGLAIVFVYLVMAAQFESFKYPFVIMFTVPLMVAGVGYALLVTETPISVTVMIGLIVLAGIVVNNAIVLVDMINQRKREGTATYDAIVEAVKMRTRPILMTALTTILGLVPLALGIGEGTEINQPMAITVIGGLVFSTFLTLIVIPVVYSFFDPTTRRMKKYLKRRQEPSRLKKYEPLLRSIEEVDESSDREEAIQLLEDSLRRLRKDDRE